MKQIKKQAGFTLIELIMVIVILGVLSAFALPRFADLGGSARAATIQGAAASMKSAANIAHAKWLADGDGTSTSVILEGKAVTMANGYPTADAAGIMTAAQISGDDYDITTTVGTVIAKGAPDAANCSVAYTAATASSTTPPVITPASVAVAVVTGC